MNIFKKLVLLNKISKAYKKAQSIIIANSQLAGELEKALLNLKADFEVLAALLPSLKGAYNDIMALINDKKN